MLGTRAYTYLPSAFLAANAAAAPCMTDQLVRRAAAWPPRSVTVTSKELSIRHRAPLPSTATNGSYTDASSTVKLRLHGLA